MLNPVFDGCVVEGVPGETIGGLLWRLNEPVCRWTDRLGQPRGYFCGMGACFNCLLTAGTIQAAVSGGAADLNAVKVLTRCGMGMCQGRMCEQNLRWLAVYDFVRRGTARLLPAGTLD